MTMQRQSMRYNQNTMLNSPNAPKVLIVEDDIQLNRLLQKGFSVANLMTIPTYNLANALNVLQTENIAVIVLDLGLPDGSGWDIIDTLRAAQPAEAHPKIIIITGREKAELEHPNARDYFILQKPVNVSELIRLAIQMRYGRRI
jgi:two-component system, OmpR family, KDP operon response regulator KdpE